jgi:putative oxidoreductase
MLAPMATATRTVHWNKPIWNMEGGAELPAMYAASGVALALTGPGNISLDRALGIRVPPALALLALAGVVAGVAFTVNRARPAPPTEQPAQPEAEPPLEEDVALHAGQDLGAPVLPETTAVPVASP